MAVWALDSAHLWVHPSHFWYHWFWNKNIHYLLNINPYSDLLFWIISEYIIYTTTQFSHATSYSIPATLLLITLAVKHRWKDMVIILCVCVGKTLGKLRTLVAPTSYWHTSNYTSIKNNKSVLLKPFGYKVITIYITHGYCLNFQTWEDSWGHLDTSKHNYSCIMAIASKALHQSKQIWGSGCYNIKHWLQAFSITF